jgi:hypothetical protein
MIGMLLEQRLDALAIRSKLPFDQAKHFSSTDCEKPFGQRRSRASRELFSTGKELKASLIRL